MMEVAAGFKQHRSTGTKKMKVLIVGGTGLLGRRLAKASIALGHPTFVLLRPEVASNLSKCHVLMELMKLGIRLLPASLDDQEELVSAMKQVDVVISALGGEVLLQQLKLVDAMKASGNIKRFLPTEYGFEADRMEHAIKEGALILEHKRIIRRAVEKAAIPYTYVIAYNFAGYFLGGLAQVNRYLPPADHVLIYGSGDKKCIWVDEDDVAMYSLLTIGDSRAENKVIHIRPEGNKLSQMEVVRIWESLKGKELKKTFVPKEEWLLKMENESERTRIDIAHIYQIFYLGDLDFEPEGSSHLDATVLYPHHKYVPVEEYLRRFL